MARRKGWAGEKMKMDDGESHATGPRRILPLFRISAVSPQMTSMVPVHSR